MMTTPTIEHSTLSTLVRTQLQDRGAELIDWRCQPIDGGTGEGLGLWRVSGRANQQGQVTVWSLVLKILSPQTSGSAINDWNYWRREAHVYESGLLQELPSGLATVRCYQVAEQDDGAVWLWVEDLGEQTTTAWTATHYRQVGRCLGQFNGRYLTGKTLPDHPWLSRHWLHQWLDRAPGMSKLATLADYPRVQRLYPLDVRQGYQKLWDKRASLLTILDHLPQTLCHRDAFPMNLLIANNNRSDTKFTAIDWAYTGIGAIGEDLAALVFAEVTVFRKIPLTIAQERADAAVDGYIQGLHDIGWQGDTSLVHSGYLIASLLRFGVGMIPVSLNIVTNPKVDEWAEEAYGHPLNIMIDYWVEVARWRFRLAEDLYRLLGE